MPLSSNRAPLLVRLSRLPSRLMRSLARLCAAIVFPFERAFATLTQKVFSVTEGFEGFEAFLIRVGWAILLPIRLLWRVLRAAARVFLPQSIRNVLAMPMHGVARLSRGLGTTFLRIAEALNLDGV